MRPAGSSWSADQLKILREAGTAKIQHGDLVKLAERIGKSKVAVQAKLHTFRLRGQARDVRRRYDYSYLRSPGASGVR